MEEVVGLVLLAGELLLTYGAEMYRVEETIEVMGKAAGFAQVEVFATPPTGLFLSLHTPEGGCIPACAASAKYAIICPLFAKLMP